MVEFFDTEIAHRTVLRPGWLVYITCATLVPLCEDDTIVFEASHGVGHFGLLCEFVELARVNPTGHEVASVAGHH